MPRTTDSAVRVLKHPETGEDVYLQPYDEYPDIFKYVAKVMFLSGEANIVDIGNKLNIPANTLRSWQRRENWTALRREVRRLAAQDAVRESRRAMSTYILEVDRGLNKLLGLLDERLTNVEKDGKLKSEGDILKYIMDLWRLKLTIVRILNYGTESRGFTPHPADLVFDGTEKKTTPKMLTATSVETILENIPDYLRNAANFVIGVEEDTIDPALLDAVAKHIDEHRKLKENDDDDDGKAPMMF